MLEFTLFKSIFDNKTHRKVSLNDWDEFGNLLFKLSKMEGYKPKRGERKRGSPLISPAVYKPESTRSNDNVLYWSNWVALDIDNIDGTLENTLTVFKDYSFFCYSSASSRIDNPKFRVVLQLSETVPANKIRHFWFALNKEFNSLVDPQTKDLSRMYYVPAKYPNAHNFIYKNSGKNVNPNIFMLRHDYVEEKKDLVSKLPENLQRALIQKKMDGLNNYNITWSNYTDCPFVNKKMLQKYAQICGIDGSGRYAYIYNIMLNIAGNAVRERYPITPKEIAALIRDIDAHHGKLYKSRPLEVEAERALSFAIKTAQNPDFL